jgi:uncharacterized iron-regulated membrane protein
VGIPVWLVLLLLLPLTGQGALTCLTGATALSAGVAIWNERRHSRGREPEAPLGAPARRQIGPLGIAGLTLGAVVFLAYVLFVIRSA